MCDISELVIANLYAIDTNSEEDKNSKMYKAFAARPLSCYNKTILVHEQIAPNGCKQKSLLYEKSRKAYWMFSQNTEAALAALKLLSQPKYPAECEGIKMYGNIEKNTEAENGNCKVFRLSNETGQGIISVYSIFTGIELYYNDIHMEYCNREQKTLKNRIEINHCRIGRYECSFGENSCCYMTAGDLAIDSTMKKKSVSGFPLSHYHGITVLVDLDALLPEVRQIMQLLSIDLDGIQRSVCRDNRCYIMRANPSIEHIFSELYHVKEQRKTGYMKIKVLELLLFLSDLDTSTEIIQTNYYNRRQVALAKNVAAFMTENLSAHYTIEQLSEKFAISATSLKQTFRGVYGTSVYSYLRTYRLQAAQKMLLETPKTITEIANEIGYENPNKFSSAFKQVCGLTPTDFRAGDQTDRRTPEWSGAENETNI